MSEEVQIADDDSCATKIRRIGDEIHNLSCRHQNDDDLSAELGSLSFMCWAYSKEVSALQAECEKLVEALEDISVTGPNEGTAWLNEIAYKALAAHRKGAKP